MTDLFDETKWIIDSQVKNRYYTSAGSGFSRHSRFYMFTNEYIADYLSVLNATSESKVLSVMASGDHAFNLITEGVRNIDTFDINLLTEYYVLGIKRAMVLKYNYQDFLRIIKSLSNKTMIEYETEFIQDLFPYIDNKHRLFWEEISNYNYLIQKNNEIKLSLLSMLSYGFCLNDIKDNNNYLRDEESYNLLKAKLTKANITFQYSDAFNIQKSFKNKYDVILLSNILDYFNKNYSSIWSINELEEYKKQLKKLSNDNCRIALHYIFKYLKGYNGILIQNSNITENDIKDEIIDIPSKNKKVANSGLILSRNML